MNKLHPTLVKLGKWFNERAPHDDELLQASESHNGWFTRDSVVTSLKNHGRILEAEGLASWLEKYGVDQDDASTERKRLGLITAGNLPLVGWHDMLCGLVSGCNVAVKASRDDAILPRAVVKQLEQIDPELKGRIEFVDGKLGEVDAVIATGSSNTTRYFDSYFGHLPHIFRSQRTGVAVLDGNESDEELDALGNDIFTHYGLGCRSTTKLFLPEGFDLDRCFAQWVRWGDLGNHNKYANNYDYHKAIWLLNRDELIENGFLLVKKDTAWVSPVGTLFVEFYNDIEKVVSRLADYKDGLQLVTSREGSVDFTDSLSKAESSISQTSFGSAQSPSLNDYADGVDTVEFLLSLK